MNITPDMIIRMDSWLSFGWLTEAFNLEHLEVQCRYTSEMGITPGFTSVMRMHHFPLFRPSFKAHLIQCQLR